MIAAACLTLALVHGLVWWWRREAGANVHFALAAVATAVLAACEVWMMRAETPEQFATALRWLTTTRYSMPSPPPSPAQPRTIHPIHENHFQFHRYRVLSCADCIR